MYIAFYVKCPCFLSDVMELQTPRHNFREIVRYQMSWKSVQWEPSCCMRTDRQTWQSQCSLFKILRTRQHTFWWRYWGPKMATVTRVVSYTLTIDNAVYAVYFFFQVIVPRCLDDAIRSCSGRPCGQMVENGLGEMWKETVMAFYILYFVDRAYRRNSC
jgi:hypothetical protein